MKKKAPPKENQTGLSLYLRHRILEENGELKENLPSLEDLKREYIRFLLEVTDHDLREVANILHVSRAVDSRELRKQLFSSFN